VTVVNVLFYCWRGMISAIVTVLRTWSMSNFSDGNEIERPKKKTLVKSDEFPRE